MARRRSRTPVPPPPAASDPLPFSGVTAVPAGLLTARERVAEIAAILAKGALRVLARGRAHVSAARAAFVKPPAKA
jgi:hypothetical protein